jgi:predicted kinase
MDVNQLVGELDALLPATPVVPPNGSLLIMVGLPGSGKSCIVENVAGLLDCVVISTDRVRRIMWPQPTYTAAEMMSVYQVCHNLVAGRLGRSQRVIFDGANYLAARRDLFLNLAQRYRATTAVCQVQASPEAVQRRLTERHGGNRRDGDVSDADWAVYQWMASVQEAVTGEHLLLDTTDSPPEQLARRLRDYWLARER